MGIKSLNLKIISIRQQEMNNEATGNLYKNNPLNEASFLRLDQILKIIPIGKTTWWNGVKSGRFPKPVKLGTRITAWKAEDIKSLINDFNQTN
jgi:prophage regulatory protein